MQCHIPLYMVDSGKFVNWVNQVNWKDKYDLVNLKHTEKRFRLRKFINTATSQMFMEESDLIKN